MEGQEGKETVTNETLPATESEQSKVKELEAQLSQIQTKLGQTEKGLKTAQQTILDRDKALRDAQDFRTVISGIKDELTIHRAAIDELSSKPENDYTEGEPKTKKPSLDERIRQIETKTKVDQVALYADEVEKLVKEAGLDIRTAPELKAVRLAFGYQDPKLAKEALEDARSIVEGIKQKTEVQPKVEEKKPDQPKETEEVMRTRLEKEILVKYKLATPEGGQPSGSGSEAEFLKKWGSGELPETKENYDRYNKIKSTY